MSTPEEQMDPRVTQPGGADPSGDDLSDRAVDNGSNAELQAALAAAEARANEARDQALRAMAELENVRRRAARDIEQAHKYALEKFAGDLVGVKDSLEMALSQQNIELKDLLVGSESTVKLLAKAFERAGVVELVPQGEVFNPELHEAMATVPTSDQAPNTVLNVVQKGYQLNGRLLRPARVLVAREPG